MDRDDGDIWLVSYDARMADPKRIFRGGVSGAPGHNAAHMILKDRTRRLT